MRHVVKHVAKSGSAAGHLEPDIESFFHAQLFLCIVDGHFSGIHNHIDMDLPGQFQAIVVEVSNHDVAGASMSHHRGRHDTYGPGARDENVFSQDLERESRGNRVTKRIEHGSHIAIHQRIVPPDVRHGQSDQLGEAPWPVYADSGGIGTQMPDASHAVAAPAAYHMPFSGDQFARKEIVYVRTNCDNLTDKFMANGHGHRNCLASPIVPIKDVNVRAANPRAQYTDENVIDTNGGFRNIFQPETRFRTRFD